jgi:hypothetical protein
LRENKKWQCKLRSCTVGFSLQGLFFVKGSNYIQKIIFFAKEAFFGKKALTKMTLQAKAYGTIYTTQLTPIN